MVSVLIYTIYLILIYKLLPDRVSPIAITDGLGADPADSGPA